MRISDWSSDLCSSDLMLKATEAAVVSRVSLRDINRVIDERILPDAFVSLDNGRHVLAGACSFTTFYFESAKRLTSEERLFAIKNAGPRLTRSHPLAWAALLREDWIVPAELLTIDLLPFSKGTTERLDATDAALQIVPRESRSVRQECVMTETTKGRPGN